MIPEDRPSPQGGDGAGRQVNAQDQRIQIERKAFVFSLKENPRGRFLRITEDVAGRRDTIIIPAPGLPEFKRVVDEMAKMSSELPATRRRR